MQAAGSGGGGSFASLRDYIRHTGGYSEGGGIGATLSDHIRHGRKPLTDGSLGKRSELGEGRDTSHRLSVDFNNMPRGTKTAYSGNGLFKEVTLNRGRQMETASENS